MNFDPLEHQGGHEMEPSTAGGVPPLLRLPYELRIQIYDLVFFEENPNRVVSAWRSPFQQFWRLSPHSNAPFGNFSILRTCHAMHQEAQDYFYRVLTLEFVFVQHGPNRIKTPDPNRNQTPDPNREDDIRRLSPTCRKLVRKVELSIIPLTRFRYRSVVEDWTLVMNLLAKDFYSLTTLKIPGQFLYAPWYLRECMEGISGADDLKQRLYMEPLLQIKGLRHFEMTWYPKSDVDLLLCHKDQQDLIRSLMAPGSEQVLRDDRDPFCHVKWYCPADSTH
ncbi:MAG: hypothetical protein Q9201_004392 [Fulgogasparrea decipioides]